MRCISDAPIQFNCCFQLLRNGPLVLIDCVHVNTDDRKCVDQSDNREKVLRNEIGKQLYWKNRPEDRLQNTFEERLEKFGWILYIFDWNL